MTIFMCRFAKPQKDWPFKAIEADSWEAAALEFHNQNPCEGYKHVIYKDEGRSREEVHFALVEVEGHEPIVTRIFSTGIWRKGNPKLSTNPTLEEIAKKLGWTHDPQELLGDDWDLEEGYQM